MTRPGTMTPVKLPTSDTFLSLADVRGYTRNISLLTVVLSFVNLIAISVLTKGCPCINNNGIRENAFGRDKAIRCLAIKIRRDTTLVYN